MHLRKRSRLALGTAVQRDSRCQVAMHRVPGARPGLKPGIGRAAAESASVADGASAARTGPQRCRRGNPPARNIQEPARAREPMSAVGLRRHSRAWRIGAFATAPPDDTRHVEPNGGVPPSSGRRLRGRVAQAACRCCHLGLRAVRHCFVLPWLRSVL